MKKKYFDDPAHNVAFERCIDILAELIEKYAGKFVLNDIGYEYYLVVTSTPIFITWFSFEDCGNRLCNYYKHTNKECQKAG